VDWTEEEMLKDVLGEYYPKDLNSKPLVMQEITIHLGKEGLRLILVDENKKNIGSMAMIPKNGGVEYQLQQHSSI